MTRTQTAFIMIGAFAAVVGFEAGVSFAVWHWGVRGYLPGRVFVVCAVAFWLCVNGVRARAVRS